ncbi:FAD binding domain-containing protein [Microvirga mediterraneensis]|uniref:Xanthine dehydrogenase family protein subunit M n=1 Tax=Microvirga mediterraneensis TaxID=2754695 RepID=A0A838BKL2_9HYPH|nr:xanthine dehydrogenase family protein subunit M [Microvirga mediterraneensis]MBA1156008.1 xanthine dehydrogenase family protein subunit M [Microvirga mediterraneensis]
MYAFEYHRPTSIKEAVGLVGQAEDSKFLAGGHTLLPTMKLRLAGPANLIDLGQIAELRGIERSGNTLTIGAMTKHAEVASSAEVREAIPALAELAELIGDPHVRNRGTIGGSVANNDPSADYPAACLSLNATIVTNRRKIAADDFFQGIFTTALDEGEIITQIAFPIPSQAAYAKFRNPASRYALVGVFVAKHADGVRVAVTGAGSNGVFRADAMEQALGGTFTPEALDGVAVPETEMNSDIHADAAYRAHLVAVMARRAVQAAAARG